MQAQGEITQAGLSANAQSELSQAGNSTNLSSHAQNELSHAGQSSKPQLIQDPFLNALRRQRVPVAIYLTNGIKLQGVVAGFDASVILLKNNTKQMVYKHAIATVVPSRNIIWHDLDDSNSQGQHMVQDDQDAIENY